jgi:hypothetical protein
VENAMIVNYELKSMWTEAIVAYSKAMISEFA